MKQRSPCRANPAAQAYAACLIAQRCLEEASADDESLWRAACALDCATFFGRFRIDPATGLQSGPRGGPRAVAAGEEARGLAARLLAGQAPVPEAPQRVTIKEGLLTGARARLRKGRKSTQGVGIGAHAMLRVGWGHDPFPPLLSEPVRSPGEREVAVRS